MMGQRLYRCLFPQPNRIVISTFFWANGGWQKAVDPITSDINVSKVGIYGTSTVSNKLVAMTFDYFTLQSLQLNVNI